MALCMSRQQRRRKAVGLRTIVIFCFFLSIICFLYTQFWSIPLESDDLPRDTIPNGWPNCTFCLVEVPGERAQKPAIVFDLTDSYGYVQKFALAQVLASFQSKARLQMDAIHSWMK